MIDKQRAAQWPDTVVLIHGMWMTPRSWQQWVEHYSRAGFRVLAPAWPGLEVEVEALRADPSPLAGLGMRQILDHYERIIRDLETPPILMGHSFGGAIVQILLDRGLGAAGVAIDSVPLKGVYGLPRSTLKSLGSILLNPANARKAVPLTRKQFHYAFTNRLSERESDEVYDRFYVPGSGRAIFQGALANFAAKSPMTVNWRNDFRAPLLLVSGGADNLMPPSVQRETARRWRRSRAVTDYTHYPERSHHTLGEAGWEEVANRSLEWALDQSRRGPAIAIPTTEHPPAP